LDLAGADHLVGALPVARPDLDDLAPVATKLPRGRDRPVETGGRADAMPVPATIENIPTRYRHVALQAIRRKDRAIRASLQ
jgi:hypothetical protein